ncbi:unnamed protein product, partial [Musa banksii]
PPFSSPPVSSSSLLLPSGFPSYSAPKAGATSSPALQSRRRICYLPSCDFGLNDHSIDADKAYRGRSGGPGPALGASPNISALLEEAFEHSKLHCSLITTRIMKATGHRWGQLQQS